jgi:hypothetical protein
LLVCSHSLESEDPPKLRLSQHIFRLGQALGRGAKKPHEAFAGSLSGSLLEKLGRRLNDAHFFGDRYRDPLVQRHAIFFRKPLGGSLDGKGQFQRVT